MGNGGPVFVVGMPRSGTTLMRSILNAHPSIAVAGETHLIDHWMQVHRNADLSDPAQFDRMWDEYVLTKEFRWLGLDAEVTKGRIWAGGPPTFQSIFTTLINGFAEAQGKHRSGEKTPGNYRYLDLLLEWFPTARAVYMIRDPRSVVASFKALDRPWTDKPIDEVAARWRRAAQRAEQHASDERVLVVNYSDLVQAPEREVARLCEHLGESFNPCMLESRARNPDRAAKADSAVSTDSQEKWRDILSEQEIAVTEHLSRGPFERLGLVRAARPLPLSARVALDAKVLWRRARGAVRDRVH